MTAEALAGMAGVILSLALAYVPGIKNWYQAQTKEIQASLMGLLLVTTALAIFGLSCGAVIDPLVSCDKQGAIQLFTILISALMANQATFTLAVKPFKSEP